MTKERLFEKAQRYRKDHPEKIGASQKDDYKDSLVIVVIGESANRHHLSLYGYPRETTPLLEKRRDQLAIFSDAISSYSATLFSLKRALTLATVDSGKEYSDEGMYSIMEILKSAGIRTHWISNQSKWGLWGLKLSVLAEASDDVFYMNDKETSIQLDRNIGLQVVTDMGVVDEAGRLISSTDFSGLFNGPDGKLLPKIKDSLKAEQGGQVLFAHFMGSHFPYKHRYPESFTRYQSDLTPFEHNKRESDRIKYIDAYDNSIRYTDHVLDQLINFLEEKNLPTALLYFSDHGESIDLARQHDPADFVPGHVDVPLILWFSDKFKRRHPELVNAAHQNKDKPFMLDRLPQMIMDLVGVGGTFYDPTASLLNNNYIPRHRLTLDGEINYDRLKENYCTVVKKKVGTELNTCRHNQ